MSKVICIAGESGSGKTTAMRNLDPKTTLYIDCDKKGLSSYVGQGGAINRILEVECKDHVFPDPQEAAETFKKNYGHLGKQFVKVLKKLGRDGIREIQQEIQRKQYLEDNNMAAYNKRSKKLMEKYSCKSDITDLLLWFAGKVNALHEIYMGGEGHVNHS